MIMFCWMTRFRSIGLGAAGLLLLLLLHRGPAEAAEKLFRWNLKPEQTLRVRIQQLVRTEKTGAGKPTNISIDMLMEMTWSVNEVSADGTAKITQSLDRFTVSMNTSQGPPIEYDSEASTSVSGPAQGVAESVAPLIGAKFLVTMNNRGEFLAVNLPAGEGGDKPPPASPSLGLAFSLEGISQILRQSAVVLPAESLDDGSQWTSTHSLESSLGKLAQHNTYTYAGTVDRGGIPREKIEVSSQLELLALPKSEASSRSKIVEQTQSGVLWFDAEAGRFVETELAQSLTLERPYRELRIRIRADTTTKMTITE